MWEFLFGETKIEKLDRLKWCFFSVFLWGLAAHGFCYANADFSHDSLLIYQNDTLTKLVSGRFLVPLYRTLRSPYTATWLIGIFSLFWLALAVYAFIEIFGIQNRLYIILTAGLFATNYSLTLVNATFIHDADIDCLAIALCVWGVYFVEKRRWGWILSGMCLAASLALYQAYFPLALLIFILLFVSKLMSDEDVKSLFLFCVRIAAVMLATFILYKIGMWWFVERAGMQSAGNYNTLDHAMDFLKIGIIDMAGKTVKYVYDFFAVNSAYNLPGIKMVTGCIFLLLIFMTIASIGLKQCAVGKKVLTLIFCLSVPLAANAVYFITNGLNSTFHHLMVYPICMMYVILIYILQMWDQTHFWERVRLLQFGRTGIKVVSACLLTIFLVHNVTFANDMYLKKNLEGRQTLSMMTRVVDRIEQTEGYVPGETEVVIAHDMMRSALNRSREGFEDAIYLTGQQVPFGTTYYQTFQWYFQYILGYPIKMVDQGVANEYLGLQEVTDMPAFPAVGCTKMINGRLVIKLSEA